METHHDHNMQEVLNFRTQYLREYLEPYYERTFPSNGPFSLTILEFDIAESQDSKRPNLKSDSSLVLFPKWPEQLDDDEEKERLVSVHINRILELAINSVEASQPQSPRISKAEITPAAAYTVTPKSLYFSLSLDPSVKNFRTLELLPPNGDKIECNLNVSGRPESSHYEALSYVWGAPTPTKCVIVNGIEHQIGRNLYSALKTLQRPTKRLLWVDALCIDQNNDHEKGWQVDLMVEIYRHAENVLIHVGDEDEDTAALFNFLNRTHDLDNDCSIDEIAERCDIPIHDLLISYYKFTCRPWFTRIWVCQEFAAAKNPPIWLCGSYTTRTEFLKRDKQILFTRSVESQIIWTKDRVDDIDLAQNDSYNDFVSTLIEATRIIFQPGLQNCHSIPCIMYPQIKRDCTNPRDVVFGLRGLMEPAFRDALYPDYTIALDDLFMRFSAWLLVIDHWGDVFYSYPRRCASNLPSWVRDFSQRPVELHTPWNDSRHIGLPMLCALRDRVWYVDGVILEEVVESFDIDEDDDVATFGKLWHLDQFFTHPERAVKNAESLLSPLRTRLSLASWAMVGGTEEFTVISSLPLVRSAMNIPREVAGPRLALFEQRLSECDDTSDYELTRLPPSEALALIESRSEAHTLWTDKICNLTDLISHIVGSISDREDLIGASLFDYQNLKTQLLAFKQSHIGGEESAHSSSSDAFHNPAFLRLTYRKTLEFLEEKDDAELIEVLLEIIEVINKWGFSSSASEQHSDSTDEEIRSMEKYVEKYAHSVKQITSRIEKGKYPPEDASLVEANLAGAMSLLATAEANVKTMNDIKWPSKHIQSAPINMLKRVSSAAVRPLKHSTFFVTEGGLPGVGTPGVRGVREGDALVWLDDMMFPLVLREATPGTDFWEGVGTVTVGGIMAGRMRRVLGDAFPPNRQFRIV